MSLLGWCRRLHTNWPPKRKNLRWAKVVDSTISVNFPTSISSESRCSEQITTSSTFDADHPQKHRRQPQQVNCLAPSWVLAASELSSWMWSVSWPDNWLSVVVFVVVCCCFRTELLASSVIWIMITIIGQQADQSCDQVDCLCANVAAAKVIATREENNEQAGRSHTMSWPLFSQINCESSTPPLLMLLMPSLMRPLLCCSSLVCLPKSRLRRWDSIDS